MNVEMVKIDAQERIVDNTITPIIITMKSELSKNED